jgi:hypothetical protein
MEWVDYLLSLSIYSSEMEMYYAGFDLVYQSILLFVLFVLSISKSHREDFLINILLALSIGTSIFFPGVYGLLLLGMESYFEISMPSFFYSEIMNTLLRHLIMIPLGFIVLYIMSFQFLHIKKHLGYR